MSKIRLAMVGCGGNAGGHAKRFGNQSEVELVALCDVSQENLDKFIERNLQDIENKPATFTDAAQMYAEVKPDAVVISTPHTLHFQNAMQALNAGCHILMEKPMVTDSGDAHALAEKVEEVGKVFVIGYNTPCTPVFGYIRDTIRSGALGKLEMVSAWMTQNWRKATTGTWRQKPELSGGGMLYDSGAHLFNSLVWTVEQPIASVQAFTDNQETTVDINGSVNIRFANGVLATVLISGNCATHGSKMAFIFDGGRIECDGWSGTWIKVWKGEEEIEVSLDSSSTTPDDNFVDVILGRADARTSPLNGINQSELMDAIYESAREGTIAKPVKR